MKSYFWKVLLSYFQLHQKTTVKAWMHVEQKLELFLLVWCLINLICGKYSLHAGNLILMTSGVNALSLGLLGNVVCYRFRLAWFVTQAL